MEIVLLTKKGCIDCDHSKKQLKILQEKYNFVWHEIDADDNDKYEIDRCPVMIFTKSGFELEKLTGLKCITTIERLIEKYN
jgi:glutaredoxin